MLSITLLELLRNPRGTGERLQNKDWTLLAISAAQGESLTPVQLQKSLFLMGQNAPWAVGRSYYHFSPYNYGPFSQRVYTDAEVLARDGLVRIERRPGQSWVEYSATPVGLRKAAEIERQVPSSAAEYLRSVVAWAHGLTFGELVSAIYSAFPEQRVNSVFRSS